LSSIDVNGGAARPEPAFRNATERAAQLEKSPYLLGIFRIINVQLGRL